MPDHENLWDEVGSHKPPTAYDGVLHRPCPNCGALAGQVCTQVVTQMVGRKPVKQTVNRHLPCLIRLKAAS